MTKICLFKKNIAKQGQSFANFSNQPVLLPAVQKNSLPKQTITFGVGSHIPQNK